MKHGLCVPGCAAPYNLLQKFLLHIFIFKTSPFLPVKCQVFFLMAYPALRANIKFHIVQCALSFGVIQPTPPPPTIITSFIYTVPYIRSLLPLQHPTS